MMTTMTKKAFSLLLLSLQTASATMKCSLSDPVTVDRNGEVQLQKLFNEEDRTLTIKMTYTGGRSWVSVGVNDDGKALMTPATVVIGWGSQDDYDGYSTTTTIPMTYSLSSKAPDASGVTPTVSQTLQNATFEQTDTASTLTFTQFVDDFGAGNPISSDSQWIFAIGLPDNVIGLHPIIGGFQLPLTSDCFDEDDAGTEADKGQTSPGGSGAGIVVDSIEHPNRELWITHGILMATAWGICAPIAIGASFVRDGFDMLKLPKGTWFKVHFYMNVLTVLMTIVGVVIAVVATIQEDGTNAHWTFPHQKVGFLVFIFVVLQAIGGKLRPGLPAKTKTTTESQNNNDKSLKTTIHSHTESKEHGSDSEEGVDRNSNEATREVPGDDNESKKSNLRVGWEWGHRIVGLAILAMAWTNCHTGINWFAFNWQDDAFDSLHAIFWGVTASISGLIVFGKIAFRFCSM